MNPRQIELCGDVIHVRRLRSPCELSDGFPFKYCTAFCVALFVLIYFDISLINRIICNVVKDELPFLFGFGKVDS